jgi:hypothetical protein
LEQPKPLYPLAPLKSSYTTSHHIFESSTTADYNSEIHLLFQSQFNPNCQNFSIAPIARLPLLVSISLPVLRRNLQQPTTSQNHQPQVSRAKIVLQFILTFKVNAIGTAKTLVLLQLQDFFLLPPSAFQSYGVTYHNPLHIEIINRR